MTVTHSIFSNSLNLCQVAISGVVNLVEAEYMIVSPKLKF